MTFSLVVRTDSLFIEVNTKYVFDKANKLLCTMILVYIQNYSGNCGIQIIPNQGLGIHMTIF